MGTGGRPGITFKTAVFAEPLNGRVILIPVNAEDAQRIFEYFKEYGEHDFVANFIVAAPHNGNGGGDENEGGN